MTTFIRRIARAGATVAALGAAACEGGGGVARDAGDGPSASLSCDEIADRLRAAALATSRSCNGPGDCELVGYPARENGEPTCNCGATYSASCGGDPVNRAAWAADAEAQALARQWESDCLDTHRLCDCTRGVTSCTDGTCRGTVYDCFNPPDAGVR